MPDKRPDRFSTTTTPQGVESYLFDDDHDGETVAVFVRQSHIEDAKNVADLLNEQQNQTVLPTEPTGFGGPVIVPAIIAAEGRS